MGFSGVHKDVPEVFAGVEAIAEGSEKSAVGEDGCSAWDDFGIGEFGGGLVGSDCARVGDEELGEEREASNHTVSVVARLASLLVLW